ncbi:MAG: hypothetical protein M5U12_19600 [Verrucomicrobia bacterium]|nr:hypothetical protein [Verrucomicrobiota bacterium]
MPPPKSSLRWPWWPPSPPLLHALQVLAEGPMKATMLVAAVVWFASAPFWMKGGR